MNNYLGGWQPNLAGVRPRMSYNISTFVKSLEAMHPTERIQAAKDFFWDIEATLQSPHTQQIMKPGLRNVQSRVLRMLSPEEQGLLRREQRAWRGTKTHLRGRQLTNAQWQTFINQDDPGRTNRAFLYGLDGLDYQSTLDARRARPIRARQADNPWLIHLGKFRAAHPDIPFREAMRAARVGYVPKRPTQLPHKARIPREYVMTPTGPAFAPRTKAQRRQIIDDYFAEDRAATAERTAAYKRAEEEYAAAHGRAAAPLTPGDFQ